MNSSPACVCYLDVHCSLMAMCLKHDRCACVLLQLCTSSMPACAFHLGVPCSSMVICLDYYRCAAAGLCKPSMLMPLQMLPRRTI